MRKKIVVRLARGCAVVLLLAFWAAESKAHNTAHNYVFQDNGTIKIGREADSGGCIVWASESSGANIVNNFDTGRQIQVALFDSPQPPNLYNPTQAGDGPHAAGSEIFYSGANCVYSKNIPLLWPQASPYTGPAVPMPDLRIHMWTEFLPDSNNRAALVRTLLENRSNHPGNCYRQQITPCNILNSTGWTKVKTYTGANPWKGDTLTTYTPANTFIDFMMTENWSAMLNNSDFGLACLTGESRGMAANWFANGSGDHEIGTFNNNQMTDRFACHLPPGESLQRREGWEVLYVGQVTDARAFFDTLKPVKGGDWSDDFNDGNLLGWELNNAQIQPANDGSHQGVKMGPEPNTYETQDLSLLGKFWGDATYQVGLKFESGSQGFLGMAIRKTGEGHFTANLEGSGCYAITLNSGGYLALFKYNPNGTMTTLASANVPSFNINIWHTLRAEVTNGFTFTIKVDGVSRIANFTAAIGDQVYPAGRVSLIGTQNVTGWFDDFSVSNTSGGDSAAPGQVSNFSASGNAGQIALSWINPTEGDWRWTRVVRKDGTAAPAHWRDGYPVYQGKLAAYTDVDVAEGETYSYAAFTVDHAGNWSLPQTATATASGRFQQTWIASSGFSSLQGQRQTAFGTNPWYYKQWNGSSYSDMTWDIANFRWKGAQTFCLVGNSWQHADTNDSVRAWVAPQTGVAHIAGQASVGDSRSDGTIITILKGATLLWGPTTIAYGSPVALDITTSVASGDTIYFRLNKGISSGYDTTFWDPSITLTWGTRTAVKPSVWKGFDRW